MLAANGKRPSKAVCQLATTERRHLSFRLVADGRSTVSPGLSQRLHKQSVAEATPLFAKALPKSGYRTVACRSGRRFSPEDGLRQSLHHLQRIGGIRNLLQAQAQRG